MGPGKRYLLGVALVVGVTVGVIGCSDDDDPSGGNPYGTGLIGTWVRYAALRDGTPDPNGGAYGTSGHTITLNPDGTGSALDVGRLGPPLEIQPFTWTRDGDRITAVLDPGTALADTVVVDVVVAGNTLTVDEGEGSSGIYQRYLGPGVLVGTWDIAAIFDDNGGGSLPVTPGEFSFRFDREGEVSELEGDQVVETWSYTTDRAVLSVESQLFVFTAVGTGLDLYQHVPNENVLLVWRFARR